tara:strand:+ start:1019 stop:1189 length:171 start_codon:yes stop_codon:yes gene_type:complete
MDYKNSSGTGKKMGKKSQKFDGGSSKPNVRAASKVNPGGTKKAKSKSGSTPSRKLW